MSETKALKPSEERIWRKYFPKHDSANDNVKQTAYQYMKNSYTDRSDLKAFYYYGKSIYYPEVFAEIDRYADAFAGMGVKKGDNVTLVMANTPESIYTFYALNKMGAVAIFVDPRMTADRISYFVKLSKSKVLVTLDMMFPKCTEAINEYGIEHVIVATASRSLPMMKKMLFKLKANVPKIYFDDKIMNINTWLKRYGNITKAVEVDYEEGSVCATVQTGGTTGTPKGVMLTNLSVNTVCRDLAYVDIFRDRLRRFLNIIPVFTSYGLVVGMHIPMIVKAEIVLVPTFKPEDFPKLIKEYKPNGCIAVPAFYELWLTSPELQNADMSHMCACISGGDKMTPEMEARLTKFLNDRGGQYNVAQGYGMSEISSVVSFNIGNVYCPGSAGAPLYNAVVGAFKPDTDEELDYGEEGEICVTGDTMMLGYMGQPEETAEVMRKHSDGRVWIHSGDVGFIDKEGFIHIKSRIKHMITRFDGHKIFPVQIENVVHQLPNIDVESCVVISCQDRVHSIGHHPLIVVKRSHDASKDAEVRKTILDYCKVNIEDRAQPCGVVFVDEMPLTGFGKIDVKLLEQKYGTHDYTKD